jgi:putative FmdB family regulatory protein
LSVKTQSISAVFTAILLAQMGRLAIDARFSILYQTTFIVKRKRRKTIPTYDYKCTKCPMEVVEVRSITEDQKATRCPDKGCSGKLVQQYKRISTAFKGEGFYSTDNKRVKGD